MPIPTPKKGEEKNAFINRCVSTLSHIGEFSDNKQRVAVCHSQWRKKMTKTLEWVEFQKEYSQIVDDKGQTFTKGQIIELDSETAASLIKLNFAKSVEPPSIDDLIKKTKDDLEETLTNSLTKSMQNIMENVNAKIKKTVPAVVKDHEEEAWRGFKGEADFIESVIKAAGSGPVDERLIKGTPTGQSTLDNEEGGFLIPEPMETKIWEQTQDTDMSFLKWTDNRFTSGQSLKFNTVPEFTRKEDSGNTGSAGYRHAGAIAYWLAEADEFTSSKIKWAQERLELHKLQALFYVTEEEVDDAGIALAPIFTKRAAQAIMWKVNESFVIGTGAGQPTGILNANCKIQIALQAGQAGNTIRHHNITDMYARMHPAQRAGAVWLVHPNLETLLQFIYFDDDATNRRPVYLPPTGLVSAPYGTLMGRPVYACDFCPDLGNEGDIIFVNWGDYVTLQKRGKGAGIKSATSIHLRFLYEETAFRFSYRIDGRSLWPSTIEDLNGTTTRSHIITRNTVTGTSSSGL